MTFLWIRDFIFSFHKTHTQHGLIRGYAARWALMRFLVFVLLLIINAIIALARVYLCMSAKKRSRLKGGRAYQPLSRSGLVPSSMSLKFLMFAMTKHECRFHLFSSLWCNVNHFLRLWFSNARHRLWISKPAASVTLAHSICHWNICVLCFRFLH